MTVKVAVRIQLRGIPHTVPEAAARKIYRERAETDCTTVSPPTEAQNSLPYGVCEEGPYSFHIFGIDEGLSSMRPTVNDLKMYSQTCFLIGPL